MNAVVLNAASLALSIVAIALSALLTYRQMKIMNTANRLPILLDFFREVREPEFRRSQRVMYERLPECSPERGLSGLPEDVRSSVLPIVQYYDNLGALVGNKLVTPEVVLSVYSDPVDRCWRLVYPFLAREREIRSQSEYGVFFEHIAALAQMNRKGSLVRRDLRLLRRSD